MGYNIEKLLGRAIGTAQLFLSPVGTEGETDYIVRNDGLLITGAMGSYLSLIFDNVLVADETVMSFVVRYEGTVSRERWN